MKDPQSLLNEFQGLREQYVTEEPMTMEELDLASEIASQEPVNNLGMEEADRLDSMIKEYQQDPEWLREASMERDSLQAQQDIDDMDFGSAFESHYEQYKEVPKEERPKLNWRGREYLPVKAEELEPDTDLSKTSIERPKEDPEAKLVSGLTDLLKEEEGKVLTAYKPDPSEEFNTIGYGHYSSSVKEGDKITDKEAEDLLQKDIKDRLPQIRKAIPKFDQLPENAKKALFSSWFRGSLPGSPRTIALINEGNYKEAAKEFLNNQEYRDRKSGKRGGLGVVKRMERTAKELANLK